MPAAVRLKPGSLKDPEIAQLFSTKDPEQRYCDLREVGSGSFGSVYYAQDKENNETVAIKKMNFNGKDAQEKWLDIIKEVRFLRSIRHKHIVQYRACFLKDYTCWMVMEYCIGSASDIIGVFKDQLVEDAIAEIAEQTLDALEYIHGFKYIHRDVKAGNILITDDGVVKLGDVGSASMHSPANSFVGSPYWMAPEVILAMEEGEYGTQADLWSFGITLIELADRRPPLYDLNTMSALYHIAQNDPPTLSRTHPVYTEVVRSEEMIDFVSKCLKKEPSDRMSAVECKNHGFIQRPRNRNIMSKLVRHTKKRVLKLDSDMYTKMKKIFYLEGANSAGTLSDEESDPEETCFVSTAPKRRQPTAPQIDDSIEIVVVPDEDDADTLSTPNPSVKRLREQNNGSLSSESGSNLVITENETESVDMEEGKEAKAKNRTVISVSETDETNETEQNGRFGSDSSANSRKIEPRDMNEEINTLRRSKFSTLRPTKVVSREIEEARRENNAKEQMHGYQRLRQYHHKEQQQLEEKCKFEAEAVRQKQEKEYEQFLAAAQKEMQKIRQNHQNQLEKKTRENEECVKKTRKQRVNANEHELKSFTQCQKREYKFNKEQAKKVGF
uniref:non-specific serine/threonine protein kinase n=1 Tax=Bursaphelenchus xylophilus TaxID=6326 RepID=A0A1I7SE52_BURXY